MDFGVVSLSTLAHVLWLLGYPDQALTRSRQALTLAQEIAHPFTTAVGWSMSVMLQPVLHDARTVQQQVEAVMTLCNEQGFLSLSPWIIPWRGWALAMQGQEEEGINQIQQGMATARTTGMERFRPYHLALLAEAYGKTGQLKEGLTALTEALVAVDRTGGRVYEAELYRLKGTLTLQQQFQVQGFKFKVENSSEFGVRSSESEAEECFLKAIEVARKQQAKSLELRATVSLARLWQSQGKRHEARNMLSEVYSWFTEGFDTVDLKEAKALLKALEGE
jgi:predicted ATPase